MMIMKSQDLFDSSSDDSDHDESLQVKENQEQEELKEAAEEHIIKKSTIY